MSFDIDEWLNEVLPTGELRRERLCWLIFANGGLVVRGWGVIAYHSGHQQGLEQNDALDLIGFGAFMDGLEAAGVPVLEHLLKHFQEYVDNHGK